MSRGPTITIYGCEPDEAELFRALAPRFGVVPTLTSLPVLMMGSTVSPAPGNRCISVGHKSEISAAALHALSEAGVEYISTRSIGLDHIDLAVADLLGITVENVSYSPDGVADFTIMLMLMATRNAKHHVSAVGAHALSIERPRDRDLRELTVGVVGVGRIGSAVVDRLRGFGCRVLTYDKGRESGPESASFEELLRTSDIVTLHVPLTGDTRHLIGAAELEAMKPGAILVNTARGALIDTDALVAALEYGMLGGAALDVLEGEEGLRLQELPHVIVTPHTAYYTERTLRDTVEQTLMKVLEFTGRVHA